MIALKLIPFRFQTAQVRNANPKLKRKNGQTVKVLQVQPGLGGGRWGRGPAQAAMTGE